MINFKRQNTITSKTTTFRASISVARKNDFQSHLASTLNVQAGDTFTLAEFYKKFRKSHAKVAAIKGITANTADDKTNRMLVVAAYTSVSDTLAHSNLAIKSSNYYSRFTVIDNTAKLAKLDKRVAFALERASIRVS